MIRLIDELWQRHLERRAAAWVVRIDDDRERHQAALRRWVGKSAKRAALYNRAYAAFHEAVAPARRIYGAVEQGDRDRPERRGRNRIRLILAIGFSLLISAVAVRVTLARLDGARDTPGPLLAEQSFTTHIGEVRTVRLPDGSRIILDTDSLIRVALTKTTRGIVLERGRARFEVAHAAQWPFVVTAGGGTITAHGTVFDVDTYRRVRVSLISGTVDVRYPAVRDQPIPRVIRLSPGQQLRFDPAMIVAPEAPVRTLPSDTQWVTGMKTFDDVPVRDILDEVNRYSKTKIVMADPSLGSHRVFLDLDLRNPQDVARNLALYLQLDVDQSRQGYLVLQSIGR